MFQPVGNTMYEYKINISGNTTRSYVFISLYICAIKVKCIYIYIIGTIYYILGREILFVLSLLSSKKCSYIYNGQQKEDFFFSNKNICILIQLARQVGRWLATDQQQRIMIFQQQQIYSQLQRLERCSMATKDRRTGKGVIKSTK